MFHMENHIGIVILYLSLSIVNLKPVKSVLNIIYHVLTI